MVSYNASFSGIGEMLRAPFMVAAMKERAEVVKAAAEAIAPVYEQGPHPGRYKEAFEATAGMRADRAYGRVENHSPEALSVEFGTVNNPAHHTMVKALAAAGGDPATFKAAVSKNVPRSA